MASIEERPRVNGPSSWRVYWRLGGRGSRKQSCTFPTLPLAESAARLAEARQHRITDSEVYIAVLGLGEPDARDAAPTVAELSVQWLASLRDAGAVQPDTIDEYERILARYVLPDPLGGLPVTPAYVNEDAIAGWVGRMRKRPSRRGGTLDADTIHRAHAILHGLLGWTVPKWLPYNPCARKPGQRTGTSLPKSTPHDGIFLTPFELERIHQHAPSSIADLVFVSPRTGLRLGEALVLPAELVVVTGRRKLVKVRQALKRDGSVGTPKSRRSRRDVTISDDVAEVLARNVAGKRGNDLVFTAPGGARWNPANLRNRHWQPALSAAQRCSEHPPPMPQKGRTGPARKWRTSEVSTCPCETRLHRRPRWHDLSRHTHASLCAAAGWKIEKVSRRMGHESIQTTWDIYGHLWELEQDDQLDAIERLLRLPDQTSATETDEPVDAIEQVLRIARTPGEATP